MTTANPVPETWKLTGPTPRRPSPMPTGRRLLRDAFVRLRASDGFSNARSMAFATSLILIQGLIALVGLASALGEGRVSDAIVGTLERRLPRTRGAGDDRRRAAGARGRCTAPFARPHVGGDRCAHHRDHAARTDREVDEPHLRHRARSPHRAQVRAGVRPRRSAPVCLAVAAFVATTLGRGPWPHCSRDPPARDVWNVVRWPLAFGLLVGATACIFRWSPRRHQPSWSWLAMGALLSVVLVLIVTIALGAIFQLSSTFGQTYGPLAGFVALLLWTYLVRGRPAVRRRRRGPAGGGPRRLPGASQARRGGRGPHRTTQTGRAGPTRPRPGASRDRPSTVSRRDRASEDRVDEIRRTLEGIIGVPATEGNLVDVLVNGDEIFPAMLDAIGEASARSTC